MIHDRHCDDQCTRSGIVGHVLVRGKRAQDHVGIDGSTELGHARTLKGFRLLRERRLHTFEVLRRVERLVEKKR